jgi:hypothetical protein
MKGRRGLQMECETSESEIQISEKTDIFILGLFNDAFNCKDYVASRGRTIKK